MLYLSIYWTTRCWHTCPGRLVTAHAQSPLHAWAHGRWPPIQYTRVTVEKQFVCHHVPPDMTSICISIITLIIILRTHTFFNTALAQLKLFQQKWNIVFVPWFGLNVQVVTLVCSGHKAHTGIVFNLGHASLNVLHVYITLAEEQMKQKNKLSGFSFFHWMYNVKALYKMSSYCTREKVCKQCTHVHQQTCSTDKSWQNNSSDSFQKQLYLPLWGWCHPQKRHLQHETGICILQYCQRYIREVWRLTLIVIYVYNLIHCSFIIFLYVICKDTTF